MIILGIDPGTAALGYGIVERNGGRLRAIDYGCLETCPDLPMPERLLAIHALLDDLISLHEPAIVAVERLFFCKNAQTAMAVGQARGVVLLAAAQHGRPVREATPNEVKSAVAGYGAADKEQVQRMVQLVLGMSRAAATGRRGRRAGDRGLHREPGRPGRAGDRPASSTAAPTPRSSAAGRPTTGPSARRSPARSARSRAARHPDCRVAGHRSEPRDRLGRGSRSGPVAFDSLVIEVGGIGYRVFASPAILSTAVPGSTLKLHTFHLVREDQQALYGFSRPRSSGSSRCCSP